MCRVGTISAVLVFVLGAALSACDSDKGGGITAARDPVLSISASIPSDPPPANDAELLQRYVDTLALVEDLGANGQFVSFKWDVLETSTGVYPSDIWVRLEGDMEDAEARGLTQLFGLQVINTVARELPSDLASADWDSPSMIAALENLLDRLLPLIRDRVHYLSIGNEVDVYFLNGREDEIAAYKTLVDHARDYIHARAPEIKVGITITADGWTGEHANTLLPLIEHNDALISTIYALHGNFQVLAPNHVSTLFPALVDVADGKPLVFQELGYPASALNGSSEAAQAEFVHEVFAAWQGREQQIPFVNFFLLHDFPTADLINAYLYYGINNPNFFAYLDSIGFRYRDGTAKAAWDVLLEEAESAGFR